MTTDLLMTKAQITAFLAEVFPQAFPPADPPYSIRSLGQNEAWLEFNAGPAHLRPGGTVSGPAMMGLADLAMYVLVLAHKGPVALAVTTNLNINFLNKPPPGRLGARARPLKLGRRLAVGDVTIFADAKPEITLAHATITYSIPPPSSGES